MSGIVVNYLVTIEFNVSKNLMIYQRLLSDEEIYCKWDVQQIVHCSCYHSKKCIAALNKKKKE